MLARMENPRLDENGMPLVIKDYYPRLIDDTTFAKLSSQISKRKLTGKESTKPSIFTHLVFCGYCRNTDGAKISVGRRVLQISSQQKNCHLL